MPEPSIPKQASLTESPSADSSSQPPAGEVKWFFYDAETGKVTADLDETWRAVRCSSGTPRHVEKGVENLTQARKAIEKHIKDTILRNLQVPQGVKPVLLAWMEID
jgi:hypothetical protein